MKNDDKSFALINEEEEITTIQDLDDVINIFQKEQSMKFLGSLETGQKDRTLVQT